MAFFLRGSPVVFISQLFLRGRPDLHEMMRRLGKSEKKSTASEPILENFPSMPQISPHEATGLIAVKEIPDDSKDFPIGKDSLIETATTRHQASFTPISDLRSASATSSATSQRAESATSIGIPLFNQLIQQQDPWNILPISRPSSSYFSQLSDLSHDGSASNTIASLLAEDSGLAMLSNWGRSGYSRYPQSALPPLSLLGDSNLLALHQARLQGGTGLAANQESLSLRNLLLARKLEEQAAQESRALGHQIQALEERAARERALQQQILLDKQLEQDMEMSRHRAAALHQSGFPADQLSIPQEQFGSRRGRGWLPPLGPPQFQSTTLTTTRAPTFNPEEWLIESPEAFASIMTKEEDSKPASTANKKLPPKQK